MRYILALSVIALLTISSQTVIQFLISDQAHDSRIINIAGRQRMLSQKIAKASHNIVGNLNSSIVAQARIELSDALDLLQRSHVGLQHGDQQIGLPGKNSDDVTALFQIIDASYETIISAGRQILDPESDRKQLNKALQVINEHESKYLVGMNAIVFKYDLEAKDRVEFARVVEIVLLTITLLVLLLEVRFIFVPITRRIQAQMTKLLQREQDMEQLFGASPVAMLMVEMDSLKILNANISATELTKYSLNQLRDLRVDDLIDGGAESRKRFIDKLKGADFSDDLGTSLVDANHGTIHAQISTRVVKHSGDYVYVLGIGNVNELLKARSRLEHHANFDTLTGLPNRWNLRNQLEIELERADRSNLKLGVLLLDLDNFKDINDTLGHDIGDLLLKEVGKRLRFSVGQSDVVARFGGDEFVIVVGGIIEVDELERTLVSILKEIERPLILQDNDISISTSIGVTLYPDDAHKIEDLFKNADQAMYAAKKAGRNRYNFFKHAMQVAAIEKMRLIKLIGTALEQQKFVFHYQPIVELATGKIRKAETLIRWQHPKRGFISPSVFIPVAERTHYINEIGNLAFGSAAKQVADWREKYSPDFQVSVNISAAQFRQQNHFFDHWKTQLNQLKLAGNSITLEITEGLLLDANENVKALLSSFNNAGIEIALDDFGTGYSSLSYIKKFDIDYIKIDQSFVANMATVPSDTVLCEAIISMAHKLGLKVIAEGVETEDHRALLLAMGCDYAQGYLFSKPVPAEQFEALLRDSI